MATRTPQGGLRKPPSKYPPLLGGATTQHIDHTGHGGRYRVWLSIQDRCCRDRQVGVALICVMDDHGWLVKLYEEERPWL